MHRSNSSLGSLFSNDQENNKTSKKSNRWKSFLGSSKDSRKISSLHKSQSTSRVSSLTITKVSSPMPLAPGSSYNTNNSRSFNHERPSPIKRQSLMLPLETTSRQNKRNSLSINRPLSTINYSDIVDLNTTDPNELEFYEKLFGNKEPIVEEADDDYSDITQGYYDSQYTTITEDQEQETASKQALEPEIKSVQRPFETEPSLSSALESYKLYTTKRLSYVSPTDSKFSQDSRETETTESDSNASIPSVPSFVSTKTIESSISIMNVSNSLWVGSNIIDLEENIEKDYHIYGSDFTSGDIFNDSLDSPIQKNYKYGHRTSLTFA